MVLVYNLSKAPLLVFLIVLEKNSKKIFLECSEYMSPLYNNNKDCKIRNKEFKNYSNNVLNFSCYPWKITYEASTETTKPKSNSKSNSQQITSKFLSQESIILYLLLHNSQ